MNDSPPTFRELFKIHIFTDVFTISGEDDYFDDITHALNIQTPDYVRTNLCFFRNGYYGVSEDYTPKTKELMEKARRDSWNTVFRLVPDYLHEARKTLVQSSPSFYRDLLKAIDTTLDKNKTSERYFPVGLY